MIGTFRLGQFFLVLTAPSLCVHAFCAGASSSSSSFLLATNLPSTPLPTKSQHLFSVRRGIFDRRNRHTLGAENGNGGGQEAAGATAVLWTAVESRKVPSSEVCEALASLAEAGQMEYEVADVEGEWELVFSTQLKSGYMPVREVIGFFPSREQATIDTTFGPVPLGGIRGQCWWRGGPENALDFSFTDFKLGPLKFGMGKKDVKTYKVFINDQKVMAAKSSSGGITLYTRTN